MTGDGDGSDDSKQVSSVEIRASNFMLAHNRRLISLTGVAGSGLSLLALSRLLDFDSPAIDVSIAAVGVFLVALGGIALTFVYLRGTDATHSAERAIPSQLDPIVDLTRALRRALVDFRDIAGRLSEQGAGIPRLAVFIEIFSLFFLRLYRAGLDEIKFFQNELTNVETKYAALESALASKNADLTERVIGLLAETERNFLLRKGESTVELERAKIDNGIAKQVGDVLAANFGGKAK
jgi:hypothetical protein